VSEQINEANRAVIVAVLEEVLEVQREVANGGGDVLAVVRVLEDKLNALDGGTR
jgi:hypothetical protein